MQETFLNRSFEITPPDSPKAASNADLTRIFNAAILSTRAERKRDFAAELYQLVESPAFEAILVAIRSLSAAGNLTERQAAEQVIETFRKMDSIWSEYAFQEGVDRLRGGS